MRESGNNPIPSQEGPHVTPEEQAKIERSLQEFQKEKESVQQGLVKKPASQPAAREKTDYADQGQIKSLKGQKWGILKARLEKLTGPSRRNKLPIDFKDF